MKDSNVQIGQIVLSRQGRDKGNYFIVCEIIDEEFVLIVDGRVRRIEKPKKKKIKHLKLEPQVMTKIAEKIFEKKKIFDSELRSGLKAFEMSKGDSE